MEDDDLIKYRQHHEDALLSVLEFKLSPDVPEDARREFNMFQFAINKLVPQGNFTENDLLLMSMMFDQIVLCIAEGLFDLAKIYQYKFLHLVQSSRGRDGMYSILESRTKQMQEITQRLENSEQKQRRRLLTLFKGREAEEEGSRRDNY